MADVEVPIAEGQLHFHLKVPKRKVRAMAQGGGFTLLVEHSNAAHTLHTQRGSPRVFKSLTTVADFLNERGVNRFTVILKKRSAEKDAVNSDAEARAQGGGAAQRLGAQLVSGAGLLVLTGTDGQAFCQAVLSVPAWVGDQAAPTSLDLSQ